MPLRISILLLYVFAASTESVRLVQEPQVDGFVDRVDIMELNDFLSTLNETGLDDYLSQLNDAELKELTAQATSSTDADRYSTHVDESLATVDGSLTEVDLAGRQRPWDTCSQVGGTCRTGFWCRRGWRRVFVRDACRNRFLRICCRRRR